MSVKPFDSIRPYSDQEVPDVVERLSSSEALIQGIIRVRFPKVPRYLEKPLARFLKYRIGSTLSRVTTVNEFQMLMGEFVEKTIDETISEFTHSGIEKLDVSKPYLFISNHRDITLDSALLNYALVKNGHESAEIAIGDNLLVNPLVADLLRLNKSFVVNRSATGIKEKYAALTELSHYIYSANEDSRSIWIAQKEGRAKDGADLTDPAILKMLHVWAKKQGLSFSETIQRYNVVPVSISYEYDPCDGLKASELFAKESEAYQKNSAEDLISIMQGISLPKGRVHIQVGDVLQGEYSDPIEAAKAIDEQIVSNYRLYPSNWLAYDQLLHTKGGMQSIRDVSSEKLKQWLQNSGLNQINLNSQDLAKQAKEFRDRLSHYSDQVQQYMLEMYANPVINKYRIYT
ncbi:MAG: 1-acyl-sn-glycerol-3-phosphate acyltransferase [Pseudomonadales bacterium]|nr:1-acyl-sn-glycerol-3-phosphate acyltransferase [Pseudomonadales bacterium]